MSRGKELGRGRGRGEAESAPEPVGQGLPTTRRRSRPPAAPSAPPEPSSEPAATLEPASPRLASYGDHPLMTAAVRVLAIMEEVERLARVAPPVEMEPLLARGAELERRLDQAVAEWAATVH